MPDTLPGTQEAASGGGPGNPGPKVRRSAGANRRPRRALQILAAAWACLAAGPPQVGAQTLANPHNSAAPDYCLNCHTPDVYRQDCDDPSGFCLLADSVDAVCLLCHIREDCCRAGQEHQKKLYLGSKGHVSGVDIRTLGKGYRPSTLPLHRQRITCRTCHLHRRNGPDSYKLLRIVRRTGTAVDWSVLCRDCHAQNY